MDKITVTVDSDLAELIPGYLENRRKDIQSIKESIGRDNFESIRMMGHSMKGSGGGYGFDFVSEVGKSIEDAAIDSDVESIETQIVNLEDYLSRLEVVFE